MGTLESFVVVVAAVVVVVVAVDAFFLKYKILLMQFDDTCC